MLVRPDPHLRFDTEEADYIAKIEWLWTKLTPAQQSQVTDAVRAGRLSQRNSKRCIIGEASSANMAEIPNDRDPFRSGMAKFARSIFYDGPTYDGLLGRSVTGEEKKRLDDIYYARIGNSFHQYDRASMLARDFVHSKAIPE